LQVKLHNNLGGAKKMPTPKKEQTISQVREWYDQSVGLIFTEYRGLSVKNVTELRKRLRNAGAEYHVIKNKLFHRAMAHNPNETASTYLSGPVATAFIFKDEPGCAKVISDFAREHKIIVVRGGVFGGKSFTDKQIVALSKLPPREILLGQVLGCVQAPLANVVGIMNEMIAGVARLVDAIAEQKSTA
jgi:large subunit ribosomal protein L10